MTMQIKEEILGPIREVFASQGFSTLEGTYDGTDGELVMTWQNPPIATISETFHYAGANVADFKTLLFDKTSIIVQRYNATYGFATEREIFIDEVTE